MVTTRQYQYLMRYQPLNNYRASLDFYLLAIIQVLGSPTERTKALNRIISYQYGLPEASKSDIFIESPHLPLK